MTSILLSWARLLPAFLLSPSPQDADLKAALSIEKKDGLFYYKVAGTTPLPDGAVLDVAMFYVSPDKEGNEDVITLWHNAADVKGTARVSAGAFETWLGGYPREPYPITYRARIVYAPEEQGAAIAAKHPDRRELPVDLQGGPLEPRLEPMRAEVIRDFDAIEVLFEDLRSQFTKIQSGQLDAGEWDRWKNGYLDRVDALKAVNGQRFENWIVWTERSAKLKLEGLMMMLTDLVGDGTELLQTAPSRRDALLAQAKRGMDIFVRNYHSDRDALGLEKGPSPEAHTAHAEVRKTVDALLEYADRVLAAEQLPESLVPTMEEHRGKLAPGWLRIAAGMPIRGQEPVGAAAAATDAWIDAVVALARSTRDEAAVARLTAARKSLTAALQALDQAVGKP